MYTAAGFNVGRRVSTSLNCRDVTSAYCQRRTGVTVQGLQRWNEQEEQWDELVIEDRHSTPAEIATLRIDFWAWLASLPRRDRWIAWLLAAGEAVRDIANRFGLTPGRISQMRRELCDSWQVFVADVAKLQLDPVRA
jgi:DNA-binding NarL/FixJ family response regulator